MGKKNDKTAAAENGEENKKPRIRRERYESELKCILTKEEVAEASDQAAHVLQARDAKEEDLKAHQKHTKGVIDTMEAELRRLSTQVREKAAWKMVGCFRVFDYEAGKYREVRSDTKEVLMERDLTDVERQQELQFENLEDEFEDDQEDDEEPDAAQ